MILPGTYANGFAPRDGEPLFPELWRGCVGAWNPGLGPSGLTLFDWSPYKNHGTLTNMAAASSWLVNHGQHALDFDSATTGEVAVATGNSLDLRGPLTLSGWYRSKAAPILGYAYLINKSTSSDLQYLLAHNQGGLRFFAGGTELTVSATADLNWHHLVGVANGGNTRVFWDGRLIGTGANRGTSFTTAPVQFGRLGWFSQTLNQQVSDIAIYNRALSPNEIRLLASRRGIAYELAPRKRIYSIPAAPGGFQPYWATQRSQMIGGGVR